MTKGEQVVRGRGGRGLGMTWDVKQSSDLLHLLLSGLQSPLGQSGTSHTRGVNNGNHIPGVPYFILYLNF